MTRLQGRKTKSSKLIIIDLDKVVDKKKLGENKKYADKIFVYNEQIFVIEEAKKPKLKDVDQVIETIKSLKSRHPAYEQVINVIEKHCSHIEDHIHGIVHGLKSVDSMVAKYASRKKETIIPVNCNEELWCTINKYTKNKNYQNSP